MTTDVQRLLDAAAADPWRALAAVVDGPLHPGGAEATEALLDRADVAAGTRVLDAGCGGGEALTLARERGARAVGIDRDPRAGAVRGDISRLPVREGCVDVVLAECVLCLAGDLSVPLSEARRVLAPGGRLAFSDVVIEGEPPDLPPAIGGALCLTGDRERGRVLDGVEAAGFAVEDVREHRGDLLAMRDRVRASVDYERLLPAMGERGERLLDGVHDLEDAIEAGRVGYVSLVATPA